jgi:hypothetical protein
MRCLQPTEILKKHSCQRLSRKRYRLFLIEVLANTFDPLCTTAFNTAAAARASEQVHHRSVPRLRKCVVTFINMRAECNDALSYSH